MAKYARVEKANNGYVIRVGGSGSSEMAKQWIAPDLGEVVHLLADILDGKEEVKS